MKKVVKTIGSFMPLNNYSLSLTDDQKAGGYRCIIRGQISPAYNGNNSINIVDEFELTSANVNGSSGSTNTHSGQGGYIDHLFADDPRYYSIAIYYNGTIDAYSYTLYFKGTITWYYF